MGVDDTGDVKGIDEGGELIDRQVIALLQDEPLRKKMGRAARQHIKENFNWDTNMKFFLNPIT